MEYGLNPFTPGSGTRPPELVGRTAELERFDLLVARAKRRRYDRGLMLQGLRGVGKTTLLATMADQARRHNWVVIEVEAQTSVEGAEALRRRIAKDISRAVRRRQFAGPVANKIRQLTEEFSVSATAFGVGVELARSAGTENPTLGVEFEDLVEDLTEELRKDGTALGLFIDEMQELEPALLQVILATQHRAAQREWPFFVCGAGLPNLAQALADARSYAERQFDYRTIGPLADDQARDALVTPITRLNQDISVEATDYIVAASDGYPYFLQVFGHELWQAAQQSPFTLADAEDAVDTGHASLDSGFYSSRWLRATEAEKRYLVAIARSGTDTPRTATLAEALGSNPQSMAPHRDSCIRKGLIWSPARGLVAFTVPGMADFIRRQPNAPVI
ncbi:ATP-binding protein [Rhodococcus sp. 05-340-1]|uniref:ATP-binding protein n=1 Tax=Nocardiaceae TaxID=85025 RepID=UPI00050CFA5F|nr:MULTISPECIES: ATP-binding protein [Rhodococcus]OZC87740.1 ATP-binding protein [Rhodococcus sp. 06-412-2C]OZC96391.1 ATP-binding protein [Rhodococcus sp. 06-412-2B]OZD65375.1 ATP-binding protein [Rhodococcus sp. 05-340-2]OZD74579.1 ATP-binding protein [Rhodococcus sp. 05-340-1]OZD86649.1 ATP-binding protein [Rhodococcus sp. 05-339-2]